MRTYGRLFGPLACVFSVWNVLCPAVGAPSNTPIVDVAPVWSAHPVGFALLTHGDRQFVAFYDADRQMTVAVRQLDSKDWQFAKLPEKLGWDSHNYVTLAVDGEGYLHLSGNMHGHPLIYYRTTRPLDITTFRRMPGMVGHQEKHCTYPVFIDGPGGRLIFMYRDGASGSGNQIFNVYDAKAQVWGRLMDAPLFDGQGQRNAYLYGPVGDRAGIYHIAYVWRETGDCATNHDLSYCRSRDLVHWTNSRGEPLTLPITLQTGEIVDPVPVGGGLLNSNVRLGFDSQQRPVISYHKYDSRGFIQVWNARSDDGNWKLAQASDWSTRYEYRGGGSVGGPVRVGPVEPAPGGLRQSYRDANRRTGMWLLDEATLKPIRDLRPEGLSGQTRPSETQPNVAAAPFATKPVAKPGHGGRTVVSSAPVASNDSPAWMELRTAGDLGCSPDPDVRYELRWETWPANRDHPRSGPLPLPTMLRVCARSTGKAAG